MKPASFTHKDGVYWPASKNAIAVCAILSKMRLKDADMLDVRREGYTPVFTNGQVIGRVDLTV
jgi:hypothetical protein